MKTKTCPDCNGGGVVDKDTDDERQCPTCGGLGFVPDDNDYEEVIKTSRDLPTATILASTPERTDSFSLWTLKKRWATVVISQKSENAVKLI